VVWYNKKDREREVSGKIGICVTNYDI